MEELFRYYDGYDEDGRLFRDNVHQIEYITTISYFNKYFTSGSYILDGCAGTGNYAFPLAEAGHKVVAGDIVPHNVELIREKQRERPVLQDIYTGSITDLTRFADETFDVVLCMGAFYHIGPEERRKALAECLRVVKQDGLIVISYVNTMATTLRYIGENLDNMDEVDAWYHNQVDDVFIHMTPSEIEQLIAEYKTEIVAHIAADGIGYMIFNKINEAKKDNFEKWMQLHLRTCEDRSLLGYSMHGLVLLRKL